MIFRELISRYHSFLLVILLRQKVFLFHFPWLSLKSSPQHGMHAHTHFSFFHLYFSLKNDILLEHQMQLHVDIGSQICDLGLIYGNECQNDRSSCLDIKLEINNGVYQMGVDDIWGYAICICGVRRYYLRKSKNLQLHNPQHALKKFREPSRKRYKYLSKSHVQSKLKRLNICEYWGGVGKPISWYNP